jgi:hypothetical protein
MEYRAFLFLDLNLLSNQKEGEKNITTMNKRSKNIERERKREGF